jgi:ParB-like nuclease family protein
VTVVETTTVPLDTLSPYPANPRVGDVDAIADSLRAHGQYRALVVNRPTMEVLAGNHTLHALHEVGATEALVHFVEVDEEQAAKIVLADNRTNDLAKYDDGLLAQLLQSQDTLDGTGYAMDDLESLLGAIVATETPFEGGYAESDDEFAGRARDQQSRIAQGLKEVVLVYTNENHDEFIHLLTDYRQKISAESTSAAVLEALRELSGRNP